MGLRRGFCNTYSGCERIRSLSGLIISGSIQMPNCNPFLRISSASVSSPPVLETLSVQSPSDVFSSLRLPNQPSSMTNNSAPTAAAHSENRKILSRSKSNLHASQILTATGRSFKNCGRMICRFTKRCICKEMFCLFSPNNMTASGE